MATIVYGSYMVRYPLGGSLSWQLQYLVGLKELGHDVYFVEKWSYPNSCYDPIKQINSDDCAYGLKVVSDLFSRYGLGNNWCFVESGDIYHGLSKKKIEEVFRRADLYLDTGAHGAWNEEATLSGQRVFIDVDPGYTQIKWHNNLQKGIPLPSFDCYYTIGMNVGKQGNIIPTAGITWQYIFNPVNTRLFNRTTPPPNAAYSTIMNWTSYDNVTFNGITYGQKDVEFEKFLSLPKLVSAPLEVAVSGLNESKAPILLDNGWLINNAQKVTFSFDSFRQYLSACKGEFSVCKNVYAATFSGWFSDKSAAYMASGRPVVVQETGISSYLPTGEGLFTVSSVEEAKAAIENIEGNYQWHCEKALEIACEYLEAKKVLKAFLNGLGL
jgi:hypothetical protein